MSFQKFYTTQINTALVVGGFYARQLKAPNATTKRKKAQDLHLYAWTVASSVPHQPVFLPLHRASAPPCSV
jgi:hypothetical protein